MSPKVGVTPVRRAEIVRATVRCLARDGYAALTMKKVAREAKLSQGILHYYFADKRAILVAALQSVAAQLDRRVASAQARSSRTPQARLRALVRACLETAVAARDVWTVFIAYWGEMIHDRRLSAINAAVYTRGRAAIGSIVEDGIAAGVFRKVRPFDAAIVILGLVDGVSLQLTFDSTVVELDRAVKLCDEALAIYLGGAS
jgi:TetR/AcrR family transcriptional repressor of bet genes